MNARIALAVLLLVPAAALAWGKKKKEEPVKPALPALKAGIHHQCLTPLAESKDAVGLIGLGILDQTRGDLESAERKYTAAFATGYDVVAAPVDLTLVNGVIWIQNEKCPVPVPGAPAAETIEPTGVTIAPTYPRVLAESHRPEGNVTATVWVGADGKAERVQIVEAGSGPSGIASESRRYEPGEEAAERLVARVQFALQALEDVRGQDFGKAKAGKSFAYKLPYFPPKDLSEHLPGKKPNTPDIQNVGNPGLGGSGGGKTR